MRMYALNNNKLFPMWAQKCFEQALLGDCMNFVYYKNLVNVYEARGILNSKVTYHLSQKDKNPYSAIILGLIYLKQNKIGAAVTILDDFCVQNPDLIITSDVKRLLANYQFIWILFDLCLDQHWWFLPELPRVLQFFLCKL